MLNVYEQVDRNKRRSLIVILAFGIFVAAVVWFIGLLTDYGSGSIGLALVISGIVSFSGYWWSDKIILSVSQARPANREKDFLFYTVTENLCLASQLPRPKLYVIEDAAPNAFATGRDPKHALICATTGLLAKLDRTELEGVVGHELSHIGNYDTRLMSVVAVLVGMIALLGDWFLRGTAFSGRSRRGKDNLGGIMVIVGLILIIFSPLIAQLIQLAISRRQEFLADANAAKLTRFPEGLARALEKISADPEPLEVANKATAHLFIADPLKNRHDQVGWFASLFQTHPPIAARIQTLRAMA